jgi:glycerol-1-phosphate dehydrogenase [NAD(P)+]
MLTSDADALLAQSVRSASITRCVHVERGALAHLPAVVRALQPSRACQVVADPNTMDAAGHRAVALLKAAHVALEPPIVLAEMPRLKPRADTARDVAARLGASGALPIAVGAGVINDVTKYAAEVARTPYVCVATAASMDGYAASGAAMLDRGFKRTFACAPPIAVIADLDVVARAPARMVTWGYGDLAGKLIAGADWRLADAAGEDPLAREPFALVQDHLRDWLFAPARIAAHDMDALRGLMLGLLISGFAMQAHGNSRPASGSDHQLSHLWEMEHLTVNGEPAAHGACVGVGAVAMLALYEWMLDRDVAAAARSVDPATPVDRAQVEAELDVSFADQDMLASARVETTAKLAGSQRRAARMHALAAAWPALRERLRATLVPAATLEQWLRACGAASRPAHLGISLAKLAADCRRARLIRRRYTLLDCLEDLCWLDDAIEAVFGAGGIRADAPLRSDAP